jgi:multicomponent K+:H+ antiporter subunit E
MIAKIIPHPILSFTLLISWLLLNNTIAAGHIVLGTILSIFIPLLTASFWQEKVCVKNPLVLVKFVGLVLYDIIMANITVAKQVLSPNNTLKPNFFKLPIKLEHPLAISVLSSTISLTPGTVSCDLSKDKSYLLIHGLSVENVEQEIETIQQRYKKPLLEVFKKC